ncbi:MAG: aromatic ring-hydroxylating dioxygenase subunit alpha [Acidimicrobiaceae bacterium]|nr:aromatic ring-hydroxylating dioxygenase subunit alpha [Acidimicrobiaceae bacterium]MYE57729.1 aromatic ring-hydroxylating dioxygenase subunit alpha [Acidimicrobiaceae bacterium]
MTASPIHSRRQLPLDELAEALESGWSFPAWMYTDPDIFALELGAVFEPRWQYLGPLEHVAAPGSRLVGEVASRPVVAVRGDDGELRGFLNVCRHRAYRVVSDQESGRYLKCGYHGWGYRLDGTLATAPSAPDCIYDDLSLLPVAVDTFCGGVFAILDPEAPSLTTAHPRLREVAEQAAMNLDAGAYHHVRRVTTHQKANWKLWYDNAVECYHCAHIHGESFNRAFAVASETASADAVAIDELYLNRYAGRGSSGDELQATFCTALQMYPGCQIIQQDDLLIMAQALPVAADRTIFVADYFAEEGADPASVERWIKLWVRTYDEDAAALEIQHGNLAASTVDRMRYVEGPEAPVSIINGLTLDAYRQASVPDGDR